VNFAEGFFYFLIAGWKKSISRVLSRAQVSPQHGDDHSSGTAVACRLKRHYPRTSGGPPLNVLLFGLAPDGVYHAFSVTRKAVSSYLAISPLPKAPASGGIFSVALSLGSPPVAVSDHPALRSPDFPPADKFCQRSSDLLQP
jgi:hypothetical protein